jgi:hypothetical protein
MVTPLLDALCLQYQRDLDWFFDRANVPFVDRREEAIQRALVAAGWELSRIHGTPPGFELIIEACVQGHRDLEILCRDLADCLRVAASAPALEPFLPIARAVVTHYATDRTISSGALPTSTSV